MSAASARAHRHTLRIEHLYVVLALSALAFYTSINPIIPHDFWWHLRAGQIIAEEGRIPSTNQYAWTLPADTPYVYGAWLGEWLFYLLYRAGDTSVVTFLRNLLAVALYGLIVLECWFRAGSWRLAAVCASMGGVLALNNVLVRPQIWAWLPFGLYLLLLSRYVRRGLPPPWLALLPVLMVFWANVHGSFALGIAMLGAFTVGEAIDRWREAATALTWREVAVLAGSGAVGLAVTLANPLGPGIFAYVRSLFTAASVQSFATEWQPPAPDGPIEIVFFASVLLLIVLFAYSRRTPRTSDLLLVGGMLWLAWSSQRNVVWYGLVIAPVLADQLASFRSQSPVSASVGGSQAVNFTIVALFLLPVVGAQPWLIHKLPLPDVYRAEWHEPPAPPLISTMTPLGATEYLRAHPGGRLFNELGYGSYLIWALPEQQVFIDPRLELYPARIAEDYLEITAGVRWAEKLQAYGADRIMLHRSTQPRLAEALTGAAEWRLEYRDAWSEIWTRRE